MVLGEATGAVAGALAGYILTLSPSKPAVAYGGLLDFDPQGGLRFGVPAGGVQRQADGTLGMGLTLAAGVW